MNRTIENGSQTPPQAASSQGLSTFGGVFTPSILTILGVIMYLRFGWVVGSVGLVNTFIIVTLSTSITFITGLSISAIATSQRVKAGGAYFMISRTLGLETGGAVGISLYVAQALSVALYVIGFAESVSRSFPGANEKFVAIVTTCLVAIVALKSARAAIRAQYFIMAAIAVSLLSLAFGPSIASPEALAESRPVGENFWIVFAVFFPAVTGIMAGVNMSGDLASPERSIPRGTLAAVGAGYVIYMVIPIILVLRATHEQLVSDPLIMRRISVWGDAILLGVWGATLSSAVGSLLGAPRVLQALARDNVLPRSFSFMGRGSGADDEPRIGTAVTFGIVLVTVVLGNLDAIAPVLTMFFLTTYGILNIAAGLERFLNNPSYRPLFRVHWSVSFIGAFACTQAMFLINPVATVAAIFVVLGIYYWIERQELTSTWGDVRRGVWMRLASAGLFRLVNTPDTKNWHPHVLVLSGSPNRRWHLIEMGASLTHNRALLTTATILDDANLTTERITAFEQTTRELLQKRGVRSLVRILPSSNRMDGAKQLIATYGLGAMTPNTILLGASDKAENRDAFADLVSYIFSARRNAVVVRYNPDRKFGRRRRIDVWWGGLKGNGGLMMILAYLVSTSLEWRGASIHVKMVVPTEVAAETARSNLAAIIDETRTGAVPQVHVADGRPFHTILHESSADADLILLGLAQPDEDYVQYIDRVLERTSDLPSTLLVLSSEDLAFGNVLLQSES